MNDPSELNGAAAAEQMAHYEITRIRVDHYRYKDYRYSKLSDAIAQARRDQKSLLILATWALSF